MPDFKTHYDRYLLAATGLLAAAVCVMLAFSAGSAREATVLPPPVTKGEPFAANQTAEVLKADRAAMDERRTWRESTNNASPYVSRVYLLKDGRLVDILEAGNDLFPGIPNKWILENDLDYLDSALLERDPDSDGFTNFEEFTAKTNPRDASSRPEEWTKLRLSDVKIEQLQFIFTGRDVKGRANINSVAAASDALNGGKLIGPTQTYAVGDVLTVAKFRPGLTVPEKDKTPFRLAGFREEKRENPRITVGGKPQIDTIEFAVLESTTGDKTRVELEAKKPQTSPYSLATLLDTRPGGQTYVVRTGEAFRVGQSGQYKLVDVSEEKATIENLATREQHTVPMAAPGTADPTIPEAEQPQ